MMLNKLRSLKHEIFIFFFFVLVRLPNLGGDIFNTDVWKWKARIFNFGGGVFGGDLAQTLQRYHPGVTLMWLGAIGVKLNSFYYKIILGIVPPDNNIEAIFTLHFFQKLSIVIALGVSFAIAFYALKKMFGLKYALVALILLSLEPFYVAMTRVVHLEGILGTFMMVSFVWFYWYLREPAPKKLFFAGLFGGLSILTKSPALFLLPFFGLISFLHFKQQGGSTLGSLRTTTLPFLKWLLLALFFIVLLWPALWVVPSDVFSTLSRGVFETGVEEGHEQFYFGQFVQDPGVSFYIVVLIFRSSAYLLAGILGLLLLKKSNVLDNRLRQFALFCLLFGFFYTVEMTIPSKKLDRYLLPAMLPLLLMSGMFYTWLLDYLSSRFRTSTKKMMLSLLLIPFFTIVRVHPDYFSFYNPLVGGMYTGIRVIEPKWVIGQGEITSYVEYLIDSEGYTRFPEDASIDSFVNSSEINSYLTVAFPEKYYTQLWPFIQKTGARATIKDITTHAKNSRYFIYPVWYDTSNEEDRVKLEKVDEISSRGVTLYNVYKRLD